MRAASPFRSCFFLLLACGLVALLAGQGSASAQQNLSFSHQAWSTEEGLPASAVRQILQSRDGFLWLATEGGAARFDGVSFTTFRQENEPAFTSNDVSAVAQDKTGNIWFGTSDGLVELHEGAFRAFHEKDGLPANAVLSLAASDDGSLLVLTAKGVSRFDGGKFSNVGGVPSDATALETSPDGLISLLSASGALTYASSGFKQSQLIGIAGPLVGIQRLRSGVAWTCSARSVRRIDKNGSVRSLEVGAELPGGRVTTILRQRNGTLAIGMNHGLYLLDGNTSGKPIPVDVLRGESITSLLEDREGNLWVGTEGSGLHVLRPRAFRAEGAAAGEAVTTVATASDGSVWFGTKGGSLHAIANGVLKTPIPPSALTSPIILSLAAGLDGNVWAGTPDGLNQVIGSKVRQFTSADGLPDDFVRSVLVDSAGVVWGGTRRGLARIHAGTVETMTSSDGLGSDSIGPIVEVTKKPDYAGLWVGTSVGISHLRGSRFESFTPGSAFTSGIVTAIAASGKRGLWVGLHQNGLSHFENGHFAHIASPALPQEIVSIAEQQGFVWLRGVRSVYRIPETDLLACVDSEACPAPVAVYNTIDGMPSDTLAAAGAPAMSLYPDGALLVATRTGLAVSETSMVAFNDVPPPVVVERLRVDDQNVLLRGAPLEIKPGHNRYAFDFAALSFSAPSKNRYRYMLEGFDRDWIEAGASRVASYTNLPARHYVFRVQAANNDGVWNRTGAAVAFRVLPPLYRRWWFYLLLLFGMGGIVFAIYRLRMHSIERRFALVLNERNRVAREVHDTLAQDFVSVSLQLDIASSMLKRQRFEEAGLQLQTTRKLVKEGLEEARQSIWNLRANTVEDSLPAKLTALVRRQAQAPFRPRLKMGGAYRRLSPQVENEVFRIAQESLSNIERHAYATESAIELQYEAKALRLSVRDNGHGFLPEAAARMQGHYGLRGMQERAGAIHGTFTIQSESGQGTTVTLLVSLSEREGEQA